MRDFGHPARYNYLAFLIWPLWGLLSAIINYRLPSSKNVIWFFTIFYAFTFVLSNESMDAARYIKRFYEYSEYGFNIAAFSRILYSSETDVLDVFVPFLSFVIANLINDHRFYLASLGLIFGYLYSRNIWFIVERVKDRMRWDVVFFLLVFALLFPIWRGINGPRFAIAANLFFYGCSIYLLDRKRHGVLLVLLTPFVHFSCLFAVAVFIAGMAFRNIHLVFLFFITTVFLTEIDLAAVKSALQFLPDVFQGKVNAYTREEYQGEVEQVYNQLNWYVRFYILALNYTITGIVFLLYLKGYDFLKLDYVRIRYASFAIFFLSCANLASLVPSGGRFQTLAYMFILTLYCIYLSRQEANVFSKVLNYVSFPAMVLYIVVQLRIGFDTIGLFTVIGNPIIAAFADFDYALIEFIK